MRTVRTRLGASHRARGEAPSLPEVQEPVLGRASEIEVGCPGAPTQDARAVTRDMWLPKAQQRHYLIDSSYMNASCLLHHQGAMLRRG